MGKCLNGFRAIPKRRTLRGKWKPGLLSWKNAGQTATRKHLRPSPNTWDSIPKPAKTSKRGSKPLNSMTTPAFEEKCKSHIPEQRRAKDRKAKRRNQMSNNNGQQLAGKVAVVTGGSRGI